MLLVSILIDQEYSNRIQTLAQSSAIEIIIFSAYIKRHALNWLGASIPEDVKVRLVSRWEKRDLLVGASDLEVYEICKERGWSFGIDQRLHGKLFVFDMQSILLGSANLTYRGLSISGKGNIEVGIEVPVSDVDEKKIQGLFDEVVWVDDRLFEKLVYEVSLADDTSVPLKDVSWSTDIQATLTKPVEYLWVHELCFSSPENILRFSFNDEFALHDLDLLNLTIDSIDEDLLKSSFRKTRLYFWILSRLRKNGEMNFGAFSSALHKALLDDPAPYRKRVKQFVSTIFDWLEFLDEEFAITKHTRTSSVRHMTPSDSLLGAGKE